MEEENKQPNGTGENIKNIHTYSSDMADAVRTNEVSVIKIALAEQKKREMEALYKEQSGTNSSKVFMLIGGVILIAAAIFGTYFLMKKKDAANTPQQIMKNIDALISYDDQSFLDATNATKVGDIAQIISAEMKKVSKPGAIKSLFLTKTTNGVAELMPLKNLLSILKVTAPDSLVRSLEDSYMVGTYQPVQEGSKPHLFLLFRTKDYNLAYAGMLDWEKTMLDDLFTLFGVDVSGDRGLLFEKQWKDIVVQNKDARILYDNEGTDILYYVFINKSSFVITDNQDTIKEVSGRLIAKNIKPL